MLHSVHEDVCKQFELYAGLFWSGYCIFFVSPAYHTTVLVHYDDVIMGTIASQITCISIVYSTVYSGVDQRKHQSFASRGPVNSRHKWPVTRKMFPFDDVIMHSVRETTLRNMCKCINSSPPSRALIHQWIWSALVKIMACGRFGAKPLSEPMLQYC